MPRQTQRTPQETRQALTVDQACSSILGAVSPLEADQKSLADALGLVLAEDVVAGRPLPPFDNAAMDGFALRAADVRGACRESPRVLRVRGEAAAGSWPPGAVDPGTCLRIMTGAPVPRGADTVVPFEQTDETTRVASGKGLGEVGVLGGVPPGANIRRAGEDVAPGTIVLRSGTIVRPQEIGLLAGLGRASVRVVRRPRVAILSTGDELAQPGQDLAPGQIYDSNSSALAAMVVRYGGAPFVLGIARDERDAIRQALQRAAVADLLLTSAGVSAGDYDLVKDVLSSMGQIDFWTVRMRPGKPLAFGRVQIGGRETPLLGLPGNPVASLVAFEQFARPAVLKMLGKADLAKPVVPAISESGVDNPSACRLFVRVSVVEQDGRYRARVTGPQGSGILTSLTQANGLMVVPEDTRAVEPGDTVTVQMLDWNLGY